MRLAALAVATAFATFAVGTAEAQQSFRTNGPLKLTVRAKSFLEPGNTVAPYSQVNPASAVGQMVSYVNSPPYANLHERYGSGALPDPTTNGPFIGARNPIGPVDYHYYLYGDYYHD
jgi:hypothetical protein